MGVPETGRPCAAGGEPVGGVGLEEAGAGCPWDPGRGPALPGRSFSLWDHFRLATSSVC